MKNLKGSHIKWWHVSTNLSKHFLNCYQTKTNRKMLRHDFQFFANLMTFFSPKKWLNVHFSYLFLHLCKISHPKKKKKKRLITTCVFECFSITLSHFGKSTWIFAYDVCHNHFWRKYFHIQVLWIMGWWQSELGLGAPVCGGGTENTMSKDECESFFNQIKMKKPAFNSVFLKVMQPNKCGVNPKPKISCRNPKPPTQNAMFYKDKYWRTLPNFDVISLQSQECKSIVRNWILELRIQLWVDSEGISSKTIH